MKLEQKIRELVPSLQELSFGCEVEYKKKKYIFIQERSGVRGEYTIIWNSGDNTSLHPNKRFLKVTGRPIQLHHVLQAIREGDNSGKIFTVLPTGLCTWGLYQQRTMHWDLTKDLSGQSEEVKKFLEEIIM